MTKAFAEPIYITRPFLPSLDDFCTALKQIWDNRLLTNNGPVLQRFGSKLSHIPLFNNGTLALQIGLQGMEISGEVITTPFTFVATTHALHWNRTRPVFVDIEPAYYTLDPERVEEAITPWTTAILGGHVYGHPCKLDSLADIARRYHLRLIYDAAHAFRVKVGGTSIAHFGDLSMFSFHATKLFHSTEGPLPEECRATRDRSCAGCGNCVDEYPADSVRLRDLVDSGLRPRFDPTCDRSNNYLAICPMNAVCAGTRTDRFIGRILELWEGWAADPQVRFRGSSGGILSALAPYCLECEAISGVLHTGPDPGRPWCNRTHFSRTHDEIVQRAGSRYSPASPCEGLCVLEKEPNPGVFIGKPTDATAAQRLRRARASHPTKSSWLNQMEHWFGQITQRAIRRGPFGRVKELAQQIARFVVADEGAPSGVGNAVTFYVPPWMVATRDPAGAVLSVGKNP